jgi:hypothetical protein
MARGFDSKFVEAQQEEASRGRAKAKPAMTDDERAKVERRRTLELQRARAQADLARATAAPHKKMLQQAIDALDAQLKEL